MDVDRLFIHTLRDLERRTNATDEYDVLMSAALLRKLLLDQDRLVDQVNERFRLKLRFRIAGVGPFEQDILDRVPAFWAIEDALDPDRFPDLAPAVEATRDQFLARRVMCFNQDWITIRDVIDQLANVEGAVHSTRRRDQRQQLLEAAGKFYSRGGLPGVVSHVRLIGRIAVQGLGPLRDAIIAAGAATWASVGPGGWVEVLD